MVLIDALSILEVTTVKMSMKTMSGALIGAVLLGFSIQPAQATINLVNASSIQGENVLFNNGTTTGFTVYGSTNQTNTSVKFASTSNLIANGGQADITGGFDNTTKNPNDTVNYADLAISLVSGGTFNDLEFNLFGGNATSVTFTLVDNAGGVFSFANLALGTGSNFFGFQGVDSQSIRSASFLTKGGTGIQSTRQVRLDALPLIGAVPEPATWGLLIVGFFGAGMAMRKSRRPALLQNRAA